jgi:hypothetical protein
MGADTARLLGVIGQLIIGLAMLLSVWLLGTTVRPRPGLARVGWFVFGVLALTVVILAAVRLPTVV